MADCSLYTKDEIVDFIKAIDIQLNSAVTSSDLDTSQTKHKYNKSTRVLQSQREYWLALLKKIDPACYYSFMQPSVIRYSGGTRCPQ